MSEAIIKVMSSIFFFFCHLFLQCPFPTEQRKDTPLIHSQPDTAHYPGINNIQDPKHKNNQTSSHLACLPSHPQVLSGISSVVHAETQTDRGGNKTPVKPASLSVQVYIH